MTAILCCPHSEDIFNDFFIVWLTTAYNVGDWLVCGRYHISRLQSSLGIKFEFQPIHTGVEFSVSVATSAIQKIYFSQDFETLACASGLFLKWWFSGRKLPRKVFGFFWYGWMFNPVGSYARLRFLLFLFSLVPSIAIGSFLRRFLFFPNTWLLW